MKLELISSSSSTYVQAEVKDTADTAVVLKSSPIYTDGETPICIIVALDNDLKSDGIKLFIDGSLEDQKDWTGNSVKSTTDNIFIGSAATSSDTKEARAKIEEVVLYNDVVYPIKPQNNKFTYTKEEGEINFTGGSSPQNYVTRLFIKDYHNIRGYTNQEVTSTNQITFNKVSFELSGS